MSFSTMLLRRSSPIVARQLSTEAGMPLTLASPAKAYYAAKFVKQVDVPTFSGNIGVLPKHVPVIAVLKPGVVTVYEEDGTQQKIFVSSGSLTINSDSSVQVLAEEALLISEIDQQACRDELAIAQREAGGLSGEEGALAQIKIETLEAALAASQS
jgi:F-type H+-transporting ATPase subunit delta